MEKPTSERRRHPRFSLHVPVKLTVSGHEPKTGEIADVAQGGCFISPAATVRPGWQASVGIYATGYGLCAASGTIIRAAGGGFAIEFADINDGFRALVSDMEVTDDRGRARIVAAVSHTYVRIGTT